MARDDGGGKELLLEVEVVGRLLKRGSGRVDKLGRDARVVQQARDWVNQHERTNAPRARLESTPRAGAWCELTAGVSAGKVRGIGGTERVAGDDDTGDAERV
eukprot:scaffold200518_cov28-Tisochrysis_lutea.AAC.2